MSFIGGILMAVGAIVALIYGIIILIKAFKASVLWGLGCLFVPFVSLVFVIKYWGECKKPFLMSLLGSVILGVGAGMMGPTFTENVMETQLIEQSE